MTMSITRKRPISQLRTLVRRVHAMLRYRGGVPICLHRQRHISKKNIHFAFYSRLNRWSTFKPSLCMRARSFVFWTCWVAWNEDVWNNKMQIYLNRTRRPHTPLVIYHNLTVYSLIWHVCFIYCLGLTDCINKGETARNDNFFHNCSSKAGI